MALTKTLVPAVLSLSCSFRLLLCLNSIYDSNVQRHRLLRMLFSDFFYFFLALTLKKKKIENQVLKKTFFLKILLDINHYMGLTSKIPVQSSSIILYLWLWFMQAACLMLRLALPFYPLSSEPQQTPYWFKIMETSKKTDWNKDRQTYK